MKDAVMISARINFSRTVNAAHAALESLAVVVHGMRMARHEDASRDILRVCRVANIYIMGRRRKCAESLVLGMHLT